MLQMSRIRIIGLALVAVFALSAVAASGASAFTTWDVEGSPVTKEKPEPTLSKSVGLKLSSGGTTVECSGPSEGREDKGKVETSGKDKVETVEVSTATDCSVVEAGFCETLEEVKAVNLSWSTQLSGTEDELFSGGSGSPGWSVKCKTFLGSKTVTCTKATTKLEVANNSNGTVEETFKPAEKAECKGGTSSEGKVEGKVVVEVPGKKLSAA